MFSFNNGFWSKICPIYKTWLNKFCFRIDTAVKIFIFADLLLSRFAVLDGTANIKDCDHNRQVEIALIYLSHDLIVHSLIASS